MKLIDEILSRINDNRGSRSSEIIALALASACNSGYTVSLLDVAVNLDARGKQLVQRLANITHEPDYCNTAQSNAVHQLKEWGLL